MRARVCVLSLHYLLNVSNASAATEVAVSSCSVLLRFKTTAAVANARPSVSAVPQLASVGSWGGAPCLSLPGNPT